MVSDLIVLIYCIVMCSIKWNNFRFYQWKLWSSWIKLPLAESCKTIDVIWFRSTITSRAFPFPLLLSPFLLYVGIYPISFSIWLVLCMSIAHVFYSFTFTTRSNNNQFVVQTKHYCGYVRLRRFRKATPRFFGLVWLWLGMQSCNSS